MNRRELQQIAGLRVQEAKVLLDNRFYAGAYYLCGYAVECALKACIAKNIRQYEFPDRSTINGFFTHDLENLLGISGLQPALDHERGINREFEANWTMAKEWRVDSRYDLGVGESVARSLFSAITESRNGVLPWLRKWW